ncbi:MAG: tRNA (adenine(22)-N(1))-methyltransferase [Anaerorhabdus sp.]
MILNNRLEKIIEFVEFDSVVADIGTDHAYVPCALIRRNIATKCYACDVIEGPLNAAKKNIVNYKLENYIELISSDGLDNVPLDTEVIIIAGMGFKTAIKILERGLSKFSKLKQVIVQINKHSELLRSWISDKEYLIDKEGIVSDGKHFYEIISFKLNGGRKYSNEEILFGPILMKQRDVEYIELLKKNRNNYLQILSNLKIDNKNYTKYLSKIELIDKEIKKESL